MPEHTPVTLIYLHGFNSAPQSHKAQIMLQWFERHQARDTIYVPNLPYDPEEAIGLIEQKVQSSDNPVLVGSSLGGYYATYIANKYQLKAVLINPAVKAYDLLANYIGENKNYYTGETYCLDDNFPEQLKKFDVDVIARPQDLYVLLQTSDETLDYRQAIEKYAASSMWVEAGGSHSFDCFEKSVSSILNFLKIKL